MSSTLPEFRVRPAVFEAVEIIALLQVIRKSRSGKFLVLAKRRFCAGRPEQFLFDYEFVDGVIAGHLLPFQCFLGRV